jgi:hypothetical protein
MWCENIGEKFGIFSGISSPRKVMKNSNFFHQNILSSENMLKKLLNVQVFHQ